MQSDDQGNLVHPSPQDARRWGLNPLFWAHVRLLARDFLKISPNEEFPGVFRSKGREIRRVELQGICVEMQLVDRYDQLKFTLDDGSGCVPCLLWLKDLREDGTSFAGLRTDEIALGRMLRVRGRPVIYRGNHQLTVSSVQEECDPNKEALYWLDAMESSSGAIADEDA